VKYFVIGDDDTVTGFRYAGVPGTVVESAQDARFALDRALHARGIGILIITERTASLIREEVDAARTQSTVPVLVEIPDRDGPLPDRKTLADLIKEALGIRIGT